MMHVDFVGPLENGYLYLHFLVDTVVDSGACGLRVGFFRILKKRVSHEGSSLSAEGYLCTFAHGQGC